MIGEESGHQICLWNGLLGSAPGHPFLAAVIETVVNNVRNRFTSVDVMHSMCPGEIDFNLSYRYDILFTSELLMVVFSRTQTNILKRELTL